MKIYNYKSGALVTFEKSNPPFGMYTVMIRNPGGEVHDKIRCNTYSDALDYLRSFKKIARGMK
jgi:hypothetical protein